MIDRKAALLAGGGLATIAVVGGTAVLINNANHQESNINTKGNITKTPEATLTPSPTANEDYSATGTALSESYATALKVNASLNDQLSGLTQAAFSVATQN